MRLGGDAKNVFHRIIAGAHPTINTAVLIGAMMASGALGLAVLVPRLGGIVLPLALAFGIVLVALVTLLLSRLTGKVNDVRALVSFDMGLRQAGYPLTDFFSEGAFAGPTLQLFLLKCLRFVGPRRILELGSGQTTKVLAAYHRANPGTHVVTLEQDEAWAKILLPQITIDGVRHDYRLCPLEDRTLAVPGVAEPIRTQWYSGATDLSTQRFDLILVDGPNHGGHGTDFVPYSRAGLLEYIPSILDDNWVMIFDDADRYGDIMTITAFQAILHEAGRAHFRFELHGEKTQSVFCSASLGFLRSV